MRQYVFARYLALRLRVNRSGYQWQGMGLLFQSN